MTEGNPECQYIPRWEMSDRKVQVGLPRTMITNYLTLLPISIPNCLSIKRDITVSGTCIIPILPMYHAA